MKTIQYFLFMFVAVILVACGANNGSFDPYTPIFVDPQTKLSETAEAGFTTQLLNDAVDYEPLLATSGTQVHLGFWSGSGNHGSLVRLLDSINTHCFATESSPQCAIWDERTDNAPEPVSADIAVPVNVDNR
ncbi:MAG: hypothetical protein ABH871_06825 [Pseudomonadota bacterium]